MAISTAPDPGAAPSARHVPDPALTNRALPGSGEQRQQHAQASPPRGGPHRQRRPVRPGARWRGRYLGPGGKLRPFRLLRGDAANVRARWASDWAVFNQQVVASAVYIFFTNILPGITFASDLYVLTGQSWGPIEVVFSTGLCGVVFAV